MPNVTNEQLLDAAWEGNLSVLKEWKKQTMTQNEGVDINKVTQWSGWTPLHWACGGGHPECVKYLIESCEANINCKTNDGSTPLHCACHNGRLDCVKYLIESCGANINCKDCEGFTPLHKACQDGHLECMKYLIESCGADINCKGEYDQTPLHHACSSGHLECTAYLIESCGVDINCKGYNGYTPLHQACMANRVECIVYLIESANADIDIQDKYNRTPLDMIDAKLRIMINRLDHLSHCNSQLWQQLKENKQENEQLKKQLEREQEEKKQKEQENEQLKQQLGQQLKRKEPEKTQKEQEHEHKHCSHKRTTISIGEDRLRSFQTEDRADTIFLCGQGDDQQEPIKANSGVLIVTVPSIQTLINKGIQHQHANDGTQDGAAPLQVTITLPNLQPKRVRYVLQCIYTGEISFDNSTHEDNANTGDANQPIPTLTGWHDLQQLILVANEFGFWRLKLVLEAELARRHLTEETMIDVLIFTDQHNCVVLKDTALRMAAEHENTLFTHPHFKKLFPHIQLMTETQAFCSGRMESDDIDDEYSRMSMMELYKVIDEDEATAQLDSYTDRATLMGVVRSIRTN